MNIKEKKWEQEIIQKYVKIWAPIYNLYKQTWFILKDYI